ncbi:MAG: hypothetical protein AUG51_10245 [Acidobacteria bacterium 13_1_20CM_3_53_8]|nr:MAG: hypothetical protein AUG51_10245 [Acidobacteria bacterium 13_1_20CM_3_53_8]
MFLELSTELLAEGYGVRFRAGGNSMHPTIRDGEAVKVEPVSALEIRRGDIILYSAGRGLTAHRVVRVDESNDGARVFHLRGDACASLDEPVAAEQTIGRVTEVERGGRIIALTGRAARLRQNARLIVAKLKESAIADKRL